MILILLTYLYKRKTISIKKPVDAKLTQKRQKYLTSFCYESSSYNEMCTDESEKKPCEPVENIELMALKPM